LKTESSSELKLKTDMLKFTPFNR